MMRTKIAEYCRRGTREFSSSASASSSSFSFSNTIKRRWQRQNSLGLLLPFIGGYIGHLYMNFEKRKEHWYKVDRMYKESVKRSDELSILKYVRGEYKDPKSSS